MQYLEKIVHLPFCMPMLSEEKSLNLLETLLNGADNSCESTLKQLKKYVKVSIYCKGGMVYLLASNISYCSRLASMCIVVGWIHKAVADMWGWTFFGQVPMGAVDFLF